MTDIMSKIFNNHLKIVFLQPARQTINLNLPTIKTYYSLHNTNQRHITLPLKIYGRKFSLTIDP